MPSVADQVDAVFTQAQTYAASATTSLTTFTNALNAAAQGMTAPTISFAWSMPVAPELPAMPSVPTLPTIEFNEPANVPGEFNEVLPGIAVDTYIPPIPTLDMPEAPEISFGMVPVVPAVGAVPMPEAPEIDMPETPTFLSVTPVAFGGVNLHEEWLTKFEDIPELEILAPTPYSYARGPEYASTLLANLKAVLNERMAGGTGLPAAVEQAIFDRGRTRELQASLANEAEVMRAGEALGFPLPPGVLAAQLREAQQRYYDKTADLSREIMIKQAELEQTNMRETIAAGMQLEGQLIDYSFKLESLTFEAAKAAAENALAIYNGALEQYKALLQGYQMYAGAYKTLIDAELSKVEVYKAQLAGEQAKADINKTLVDQYKAGVEAGMARVEIYRAQVGAAKTLVELEQAKIGAVGEQIRAFVAQVNAETSKVEVYKAQVQGEATKADAFKSQAEAYAARAQVQAEFARAQIGRYSAISQAKSAEWDGYRARLGAETARIEALSRQSEAIFTGYKAHASAIEYQAAANIKQWEAVVTNYQKGRDVLLQTQKINSDNLIATRAASLDAAKAGAQVYAQLAASSYGMMNASAGIQGTGTTSVNYSYGGEVAGTVTPLPAA